MGTLRILHLNQWFPKPSETFIFREVEILRSLDAQVEVFSLYGRWMRNLSPEMLAFPGVQRLGLLGGLRALASWLERLASEPKKLASLVGLPWDGPLRTFENAWAYLCGAEIARRALDLGVQHIHAPWAGSAATAALVASSLTDIPFSFAARAKDIHPPDRTLQTKLERCCFVRVNTRANLNYLRELSGPFASKVKLVYNPLTRVMENFGPQKDSVFRLLAVGRLVPKKGFDDLLKACSHLASRGLCFQLSIAGDGPLRKALRRQAEELGLNEKVKFLGWITHDQLPRVFGNTDLLVAPSKLALSGDRDGIPNVLIEALASQIPVVACSVGGIAELVIDRKTGLLLQPGSPELLAQAIHDMASDPELAKQTARAGQLLVKQQFDPQENCLRLLQLFRENSI